MKSKNQKSIASRFALTAILCIVQIATPAYAIQGSGNKYEKAQPYKVPDAIDSENRKAACEHLVSPSCSAGAKERLGSLLELSCKAKRSDKNCDEIEKNVEDKSILLNCDTKNICTSFASDASAQDCIINGLKISGKMLAEMNPVKLTEELYSGITNAYSAAESCFENKNGEKDKMMEAYEMMVDPRTPKWHIPPGLRETILNRYTCSEAQAHLFNRYQSQQREILAYMQAGKMAPPPQDANAKKVMSLKEAIEKLQKDMGLPLQCYTPKAQAELACSLLTTALVMTGVTVVTGAAGTVAVRTLKTQMAKYGASRAATGRVLESIAAGTKVDLADAGVLSESGRLASASKLLGRTLTASERQAVIDAHVVGADTGAGYGTYTTEQIRQKTEILKNAGFSTEERSQLMRNGITGQAPNQAPALTLSPQQAQTRFASLQTKAKDARYLNTAEQSTRENETRTFVSAVNSLADKTIPAADRMNSARMAAQQAANYGDMDMARSFGARGVQEAKAAFAEAQAKEPGLKMADYIARRGNNFDVNYETAANIARDRQAINEAARASIARDTSYINRAQRGGQTLDIQTAAVERAVSMESSFADVQRREIYRTFSAEKKTELYLQSLRGRLAVMEGSGVSESNSTLLRVRQEIQKLDPTYLQQKP